MFARLNRAGLSWKVQLAPVLLIVMLLALGAYALLTLRDNQVKLDALMSGPVRQAELAADLNSTIWAAHARLYRLAATAANETDSNKILAMAKEASAASARILDAVTALEAFEADDAAQSPTLKKLHAAATSYLKQAKNAIEMADGDAGSAMMFIKGAERPFAEIDKLTDELSVQSSEAKDREIARSSTRLEQQQRMLGIIIVAVALAGFAISFRIGRSISKPVVAMTSAMRELAGGKFDVRLPGLERADEVGQMARAVDAFKAQAITKAESEAAEREQRNRELAHRQQEELQRLADKFEAAVGEIIETVSNASADLETAATGLTRNTEMTRELLLLDADLLAFALDQALGRLALVSHRAVHALDGARDGAPGDLGVLHRLGRLHLLDRLDVTHFGRRRFRDVDRAAHGDRAARRYRGQFRQGRSYRHGLSLSFDGCSLTVRQSRFGLTRCCQEPRKSRGGQSD